MNLKDGKNMDSVNENDIIIFDKVGISFEKRAYAPTIADWWDSKFSRVKNGKNSKFLWALRNVSFSVKKGEMIGLIGKNAAGKSTLLRVVSQILPPDEGNIQVRTECHLLARGVGLKPELSGRDNIFLGCLFLGSSVEEIKKNFDSLVEFSELEEDIDRPVNYYSSGMTSRLLFTIATSINPEFLLLDELLSGGDASFKQRAHNKMREVIRNSKGGIIATHDTNFVMEYCAKALYLVKGTVRFFGEPKEAVELYKKDLGLDRSSKLSVEE